MDRHPEGDAKAAEGEAPLLEECVYYDEADTLRGGG